MRIRKRLLRVSTALGAALLITASCASSRSASFDDARIKEDVTGALIADHIEGITVSVSQGRVTLVGLVPGVKDRQLAVMDAERVPGVRFVDDQIEVRSRHQ